MISKEPSRPEFLWLYDNERGFPGGSEEKNPPTNAEDVDSIPESRAPEEVNGNPLQCSCLGNHMDRGALQDTVHGVTENQTRLSD